MKQTIIDFLKKKDILKLYYHDALRFIKYSMVMDVKSSQERMLGIITNREHVIEKGLTMPETRLGFGRDNLIALIELCKIYKNKYDCKHEQFLSAISVIKEYKEFHEHHDFKLDDEVLNMISTLVQEFPDIRPSQQVDLSSSAFFSTIDANFDIFAHGRHTVRNYSTEDISDEELKKVMELAKTAPSACNRQPVRVHICKNQLIQSVLCLQNGNRGFGKCANAVLIVTCNLSSYLNSLERNAAFVDGGIFVMNLLYSLHYHKIGACTLNWSTTVENDRKLRELIKLEEKEEVICLITVGKLPGHFKVAKSERLKTNRLYTFHR